MALEAHGQLLGFIALNILGRFQSLINIVSTYTSFLSWKMRAVVAIFIFEK